MGLEAHLIADSGYVGILLSIKGPIRDSTDALLHVCPNLLQMILPVAGGGKRIVQWFHLHSTDFAIQRLGYRWCHLPL